MRHPVPTRWELLWLAFADKADIARIRPRRLRPRRAWTFAAVVSILIAASAGLVWAVSIGRGQRFGTPIVLSAFLALLLVNYLSARGLFHIPVRILARRRTRLLREPHERLAALLHARRSRWLDMMRSSRPTAWQSPELLRLSMACLLAVLAIAEASELLLNTRPSPWLFWVGVALPTVLLAKRLARRDAERLAAHHCMNCGYPLSQLPCGWVQAPTDAGSREPLGPEHCPECGCPWPLIPPEPPPRRLAEPARRSSPS